jgi:hypothetical protein
MSETLRNFGSQSLKNGPGEVLNTSVDIHGSMKILG